MTAAPDRTFVCPVLIGRAGQLDSLTRLLQLAHERRPQAVLLAGEAGIGKSRLVAETKALAFQLGFQVMQGSCFEQDRALPFSAMLELLRSSFASRSISEIESLLGPLSGEIV